MSPSAEPGDASSNRRHSVGRTVFGYVVAVFVGCWISAGMLSHPGIIFGAPIVVANVEWSRMPLTLAGLVLMPLANGFAGVLVFLPMLVLFIPFAAVGRVVVVRMQWRAWWQVGLMGAVLVILFLAVVEFVTANRIDEVWALEDRFSVLLLLSKAIDLSVGGFVGGVVFWALALRGNARVSSR